MRPIKPGYPGHLGAMDLIVYFVFCVVGGLVLTGLLALALHVLGP